jgi:tripartite ATP-independent transporter DctP family solute receptor
MIARVSTPRIALVLAAVIAATTARAAEPLKMRAAHVFDETHAWHKCFQRLSETLKAKTGGELDLQIFPGGMLGQEKEYVPHLLLGQLDLAVMAPAWAGNLAKQMAFLDMLFLWRDREHWAAALDGEVGRKLAEMVERETAKGGNPGLKVLGYLGGSERYVMSRKQGYASLDELSGLKLRVLDSPPQIETWKLLGATPVPMPFNQAYGALKAGTVDGMENEMANAFHMKLHEVAPHITETAHIITVRPLLISGHTWRRLTAAQQAVMLDAARDAVAYARNMEWRQNEEAMGEMRKAGVRFYPFSRKNREQMRELTQPIREGLAKELGMTEILQAIEHVGAASRDARASR